MSVINNIVLSTLLLVTPSVIFLLEAYLEVVVIALKTGTQANYDSLNRKEHFRSGLLATAIISPFVAVALWQGLYWLVVPILINRRLVFDPALKAMRKRRMDKYEGTGPVDRFFSKLFGIEGAKWEIASELAVTLILFFIQIH
jgi:hypothetical protein